MDRRALFIPIKPLVVKRIQSGFFTNVTTSRIWKASALQDEHCSTCQFSPSLVFFQSWIFVLLRFFFQPLLLGNVRDGTPCVCPLRIACQKWIFAFLIMVHLALFNVRLGNTRFHKTVFLLPTKEIFNLINYLDTTKDPNTMMWTLNKKLSIDGD